jgi:hypothetical protein
MDAHGEGRAGDDREAKHAVSWRRHVFTDATLDG